MFTTAISFNGPMRLSISESQRIQPFEFCVEALYFKILWC